MKFWFSSTDGAPIIMLIFYTVFCVQGSSAEAVDAHSAIVNGTVEIPCSLDDRNRTDCNSSSPVSSGSPELWMTPNLNSSVDSNVLCESDGCSTKGEQEDITSHDFSSVSALDSISESDNQTEAAVMIKNFTATSTPLNETVTLCPLEGCLESNGSVGDELTPLTNSSNLTENLETTSLINSIFESNVTLFPKTSTINDSVVIIAETMSNLTETTETMSNSTEMAEIMSNSTETTNEIMINSTEIGDVVAIEDHTNMTTTELSHSNISTPHTVEASNSTETDVTTEHPTTTDADKNASVPILITSIDNSSYTTTELVESTTVYSYPVTSPESLPNTTTDLTSVDNTTSFYTAPSSSNSSTSSDENTESSTDAPNTITNTTTTTNTESPSISPPEKVHVIVELRTNCSDNGQEREIALLVAQLLNATLRNDYNKGCSFLHNVSLSIMHGSIDFVTIQRVLSERLTGIEVVRVIFDESSANITRNITPPPPDNDITQSEMILYITLGVSLGAIFLIALAIICFKCCRRRPSKPVDLDVPHLNLRLEDYTLTRIPRPNTCYLDYFRGPIVSEHYSTPSVRSSMNAASESNRGMVQPFDTSVVPLEDAKKLDQVATTPNRTSCPSTPLRTFGRKDWKNGDKLIYENVISSSTEKLHPDFYKYGYAGTENPSFAA